MNGVRFKRGLAVLLGFLLILGMIGGHVSQTVYAKERRTVRVAFFTMYGDNEISGGGSFCGMDGVYMVEFCRYADWEIEFVECKDWDEALQFLSEKKVDLVGTAQYSAERAATFQYADLASGYTFGIIATNPDSPLAYEDFEAMKGITFGMVKTYVRRNEFHQYLTDHGIRSPRIREYDSSADLQAALANGEVDALVHTFMEIQEGQRLIGRFAPRPFYYITYRGNDDVMRELNQAIADLKMNNPDLETRLMNEFYQSRLDRTIVFTVEEKQFIKEAEPIRVGYFDNYYPFLYEEDGVCRGLTRDLLEGVASLTGLTLTWHKVESPQEASQALQNKVIDVMSYCVHTDKELAEHTTVKMKDYVQIPMVLVMKKSMEPHSVQTLATVSYLSQGAEHAVDLNHTELLICDTQQECLDALRAGKADAVLCDGYLAEYLLSAEIRYYDLEIKSVLSEEHGVSMTVLSENTQLAGILNKTILTIDARAVRDYMLERNVYSLASFSQYLQEYSHIIIGILLLVIVSIIFVALHILQDTKKIQMLMYQDVETNIGNLNYLMYVGKKTLLPERTKQQYAVAYLRIVQFQRYKMVYGWKKGKKTLASIAASLQQNVNGKGEVCARADGDRFALLLSIETGNIIARLQRIKNGAEERVLQDTGTRIEIQIGVYFMPPDDTDLHRAIVCANQSIDFIQDNGGSIQFYDDSLEKALRERHEREQLLDSIDIDSHFAAYYQAKVDVRTEKIVGAEALVRFIDPTKSGAVISPGFFVPYFEQTGRVTEIDFFVLRCVCQMLRRRLDEGKNVVTVSCNFSRMHFTKPGFVERFEGVLSQYDIPKDLIEVEITETLVMEEIEAKVADQTLDNLHAKGIRISIDDFGAGYSSLGVIEKIPASVIKLDRSFLLNQEDRERQVKIMKSIVDLAGDLGAQIVCEGVETDKDVELMKEIGAHVAQGYRYAKPVPEADFEQRLSDNMNQMTG